MKKVINKFSEYINYFLIFSIMIMFFINFIRGSGYESSFRFDVILWSLILPLLSVYLYKLKIKEIKITKYDIIMFIFLFLLMVSTRFSIDMDIAILGYKSRNEGLLCFIAYIMIFLNAKSIREENQVKKIIKALFIFGIFQFIYSFFQVFLRFKFIRIFDLHGIKYMASGFVGNPNFLGSIVLILLCLSTMLWLLNPNRKIYLILTIIFFINLIFTQSTGPFFSYIISLIFIMIFLHKKNKINWKKISQLMLILVITFLTVSNGIELYCKKVYNDKFVSYYTIKGDIENTFSLFLDKENNEGEEITIENYGSGRITIWKNSLKIVPKYFFVGSGLDTFGLVYPDQSGIFYDKAHNEYLQMLITCGIFTLITYLIFLFNLFLDGIRSNNKLVWVLLIAFIGYALQAFMNISVINVAPIFYMIMGILAGLVEKKVEKV